MQRLGLRGTALLIAFIRQSCGCCGAGAISSLGRERLVWIFLHGGLRQVVGMWESLVAAGNFSAVPTCDHRSESILLDRFRTIIGRGSSRVAYCLHDPG